MKTKKLTPKQLRDRRNARQQAYRARPGRAEADARASRRSYWRKTIGDSYHPFSPGTCTSCAEIAKAHDL